MDQPTSTFSHISPPPQSSPSQPKASFSSPSFIRPPPSLNSTFYPTPRATPRIKKEEEEVGSFFGDQVALGSDDDPDNNWGDDWMDQANDFDGEDVDDEGDVDLPVSEWDAERSGREVRLAREAEARTLEVSRCAPAPVPVNENSTGLKQKTLGAGRPKRKALLCFSLLENEGEGIVAGTGERSGRAVASSVVSHPVTGVQTERKVFRLGTSTSFKKIKRIPPEMKKPEAQAAPNIEIHADDEAAGKDEIKTAAPNTDDSTSKGEGSSTQITTQSAEAKVKVKTEASDETAVKGELSLKVENDDAKASTTNPASTSDVKEEKVKTQVA